MLYQCENCFETHERKSMIIDCNECGDEVCNICKVKGKDGEHYCENCIDEVNERYDKENKDEEEEIF